VIRKKPPLCRAAGSLVLSLVPWLRPFVPLPVWHRSKGRFVLYTDERVDSRFATSVVELLDFAWPEGLSVLYQLRDLFTSGQPSYTGSTFALTHWPGLKTIMQVSLPFAARLRSNNDPSRTSISSMSVTMVTKFFGRKTCTVPS